MSKRNPGWSPDRDDAPWCDECGALCERGYLLTGTAKTIERVICFDCAEREDLDEYRKTRRLAGWFTITATVKDMRGDPRYAEPAAEVREIDAAIKAFAVLVWPDVSATIDAEKKIAGMSVERDGLAVRSFVSAGRVMLHVERGDVFCCAIGEEGNPARGLGLQGIGATKDEAVTLWRDAAKLFLNGGRLVADRKVSIL